MKHFYYFIFLSTLWGELERKQTCAKEEVGAPGSNYYSHFIAGETETQVHVQQAYTGNLYNLIFSTFTYIVTKPSQEFLK